MTRPPRARPLLVLLTAAPLVASACRTAQPAAQVAAPTGRIESSGYLTGTDPVTAVNLAAPAWVALVADFEVASELLHPETESDAVRLKAGTHRIGRRQVSKGSPTQASSQRCTRGGASGPVHAGDAAPCAPGFGSGAGGPPRPARALLLVTSARPLRYTDLRRALDEAARDGGAGTIDGFVARLGERVGPDSFSIHVLRNP